MSLLGEIEKIITEHASASVMEKRLELVKEQAASLEKKLAEAEADKRSLQQQTQQLVTEIERLKAEMSRPTISVSDEELAVLRILESDDRNWKPQQVADAIGANSGRTHYLLSKLRAEGYAYEAPTGFHIEDKGRAALHGPLLSSARYSK